MYINLSKDSKSDMLIITTIDSEGFHKQLYVSEENLNNFLFNILIYRLGNYGD